MPSKHVFDLCSSSATVTKEVARNPTRQITKSTSKLYRKSARYSSIFSIFRRNPRNAQDRATAAYLEKVAECAKFPYRPSDLFLKIYSDVLDTLDKNPMIGVVSPPLLGSAGVIPLSIVSVIPDIMRHYAELIVRAESEIFLATNYWEPSRSSSIVATALRELSRRVGERNVFDGSNISSMRSRGRKVVVKIMYDRGTPAQLLHNHVPVKVDDWVAVRLPKPEEIPNLDLEVVNYHRPLVGTFHAKFMVVDRKVACLNSNNVQDRPNVEMMIHLEGPIVESFYDMALITWSNALKPPLPLLKEPPIYSRDLQYFFGPESEYLQYINFHESAEPSITLRCGEKETERGDERVEDSTVGEEPPSNVDPNSETLDSPRANSPFPLGEYANGEDKLSESDRFIDNLDVDNGRSELDVKRQSRTTKRGTLRQCEKMAQEVTNTTNSPLAAHSSGEELTSVSRTIRRVSQITEHLNAGAQNTTATIRDEDTERSSTGEFSPYLIHEAHRPCPIAMVNRVPRGTPGHENPHGVPQDAAFLGAFKHAEKSVFIQTPTFNAKAAVRACIAACMRGIEVTLYLDLGFNDLGEMIPFQGGTNEQVVIKMYKELNAHGKGQNLKVYWYTAKDQSRPMNAALRKRNCHVKFLAVDDQVAILGNGNQDTQSWFHSQEINVMVDSTALVTEWMNGLNANQNTRLYGKVDHKDGIWRDEAGGLLQSSGLGGGFFGTLKGIRGAIRRLRGTGGF